MASLNLLRPAKVAHPNGRPKQGSRISLKKIVTKHGYREPKILL